MSSGKVEKVFVPQISAILPLYNGIKYITESIESIQNQTFSDWELIIVNEYGSDDGSVDVVQEYAKSDSRIRLIQNTTRLGLAESLNVGIAAAKGEYIARVDVDDPSYPERFEKQVKFLEEHPEIALCGTLQRSVLPDHSYVEKVPCETEELKAALLFGCEISHCSVMFRRQVFLQNSWKYDGNRLSEDYDLWTKIMFDVQLCNLPEVLVDHRWGFRNISLAKGEALYQEVREISARSLERFGIKISGKDLMLLSGWRNRPEEYARKSIAGFLKKTYKLLDELALRNKELHLIREDALQKILWKRWNWACKTCGLFFREISYENVLHDDLPPIVSVVLPVYEAVHTLRETIDSILVQDYEKWELLIVCEYGNFDGSTELAKYYAKLDKRIRIIENREPLGLAKSLNEGIRNARGKYIARIDADDLANAKRLSTQVAYMEKRQNVGITQFYQHYFGNRSDGFIHRPPLSAEAMKAKLLFFCDACHSTVMIRKSIIDKYQLFYTPGIQLEDYELWTRMVRVTSFETIPEVYGEYRVGMTNISAYKSDAIQEEMCKLVAGQLKENLGIQVPLKKQYLLGGWKNIFPYLQEERKQESLIELQSILLEIWKANLQVKYYSNKELLSAISAKWRWSKYDEPWQGEKKASNIADALELPQNGKWISRLFRYAVKKPLSMIQTMRLHLDAKNMEHLSNLIRDVSDDRFYKTDQQLEYWTWERYERTEKRLDDLQNQNYRLQNALADFQYQQNRIPYYPGEKIRIVFLFQVASFWPSWESFFEACQKDERIDAKLIFLDETNTEKTQMLTAYKFLEESGLPYVRYEDFPLEEYSPHVVVIQTPYDEWHRKEHHWSNVFHAQGYRIVYIPYGVEISDTDVSHILHFKQNVINNCWRIYTFSEVMRRDYWKYCENRRAVVALGLPRFDIYYKKPERVFTQEMEERRKGRPVVLWKVHFPKVIYENGRKLTVTPELNEYLNFARKLKEFPELFFIFMPHPKFREMNNEPGMQEKTCKIMEIIAESENAWIDESDDYRNSLLNADYIIVDRSAVMVEAGAMDVPVLFMSNVDYYEPVTQAIKPLIDSYYQGNSCQDMIQFLHMCMAGKDTQSMARKNAFRICIPDFDGNAGERIKENIIQGVMGGKA